MDVSPNTSLPLEIRLPKDPHPQAIKSILIKQIGLSDQDATQVVDSAGSQDTLNKWDVLAQKTGQKISLHHSDGFRIGTFYPDPDRPRKLYH